METESNSADFASLAEAKTAFAALQGDLEAAQSLANEAGAKIEALTAELADAKSALDTANAELATVKQSEADSAAKLEALTAEIAQLKSEAKTAEQKAAEIAASAGVDPVANAGGGETENAWEKYQSIKDPAEKTAYWRANADAIIAAARKS